MHLIWLALAWLIYALLHSVLASHACKQWVTRRWPGAMPYYRLGYNLAALLTLLPIAWMTFATEGQWLWRWHGVGAWLANGLALAAVAGFVASSRHYDMDEFLGLRQLRARGSVDPGGFVVSPFHRFVRHPWYCFGLVLLWSRDMNPPTLVSALAITLYFIVGSRLEERKLRAMHGASYEEYARRVAALFPLPGKILSRAEAESLSCPATAPATGDKRKPAEESSPPA